MFSIKKLFQKYSLISNRGGENTVFLWRSSHKKFSFYTLILTFVFVSFSFSAVFAAPSFAPGTETLRATAQACNGRTTNFVGNSFGAADGATDDCSEFRANQAYEFTAFDARTVTDTINTVTLNLHFYMTGLIASSNFELQVSVDNGGTWDTTSPIDIFTSGTAPGTLTTNTYPITSYFPTTAEVDGFQVRIIRSNGGARDSVFIYIDAVELTVETVGANNTPVVSITAPTTGSSYSTGSSVSFTGTSTDVEDGNLTAGLSWSSDLDGVIGAGGSFSTSTLSVGSHTITASSTDSGSATGTDSIIVNIVADVPPTVVITAPADGSIYTVGSSVSFTGTSADPEDGNLTAGLSWSSNIDGVIGAGGSFSISTLSLGAHTITASSTDSGSNVGTDAITVNIVADQTPTVTITAPGDGATFTSGVLVAFTGTATDVEDGNLNASIQWSSNLDGVFGVGASVNISTLSIGAHTITASATDSALNTGTDSITVNIVADQTPVVTITAPADASTFVFGATINFTGTSADPEEGNLTAGIAWSSDINGALGSSGSINVSTLSVGVHTITASSTDSASNTGTDSITVNIILDLEPVLTVTSPVSDMMYASASPITFTGTATDIEDGNISANINWSSNLDGAIGTGASIASPLSDGIHLVTASITDSAANVVIKKLIIYVGVVPPTPHGGYDAVTDQCARCHRAHTTGNQSLLIYGVGLYPPQITDFCMTCHDGSGAPSTQPISTHSNYGFLAVDGKQEDDFRLGCNQCHEVHGSSNLSHIKTNVIVDFGPIITAGPVVFSSFTGVDSFDEIDSVLEEADDLCVTCHISGANSLVSHPGGDHTSTGWGDQRGNDCTFCHKHSRDGVEGTEDGFMPLGCTGCHNSPQDNGDGFPVGGRVAVTGDFATLSHHIVGTVTDAQCLVCHDITTHMNGIVELYDEDSGALISESSSGAFRNENLTLVDRDNLTTFCKSCHDIDGATRGGVPVAMEPFGDGAPPPPATLHSNVNYAGLQEEVFGAGTVACIQCHASHGSTNLSIIDTDIIVALGTIQSNVVYTATGGADSLDEVDGTDADDLCATCHENSNNPGFPVNSHTGGDHTAAAGSDLRGGDCTGCHTHDFDNDMSTLDGFMPPVGGSTCLGCHNQTQGSAPVRRQIVDSNSDGTGTGGDFLRASHHIQDPITYPFDADCEVCHDQSSHMGGNVTVFNADNTGTSYILDDGTTDGADYVNFCISCHDADASVTAGGAPFSDAVTPPIIDATTWAASSHGGNYTCDYCHSNGHGSNKIKLLSSPNMSSDYTYTTDGDPDDPLEEEERFCFLCHDGATAATDIAAQFATTENRVTLPTGENSLTTLNDRHDVQDSIQAWSGSVIECWSCHNTHGDNAALKVKPDPDPGDGRTPGTGYFTQTNTSTFMSDWCMDCHDNSFPSSISVTNALADIYTASNASGNSHGAGSGSIGTLEGGFGYVEDMWLNCEYCHSLGSHVTPAQNGSGKNNLFNIIGQTEEITGWVMNGTVIPNDDGNQIYGYTDQVKDDAVNGYDFCQTCHTGSMGGGNKKANCADCHYHGPSGKW